MTRYDMFRRRIAPVAFGLAIVLMARDACHRDQSTHAMVIFEFGSASQVRALEAKLVVDDEPLATFHRNALGDVGISTAKFDVALPAAEGELRIDLDLGTRHARTTRHFHAEDGSTVTVPLSDLAH